MTKPAGVRLRARVRGDTLDGAAEAFTDVAGADQPIAPVTGLRVACTGAPVAERGAAADEHSAVAASPRWL